MLRKTPISDPEQQNEPNEPENEPRSLTHTQSHVKLDDKPQTPNEPEPNNESKMSEPENHPYEKHSEDKKPESPPVSQKKSESAEHNNNVPENKKSPENEVLMDDGECASAAAAIHEDGMYVHAGTHAALVIASWHGRSTAFKLPKFSPYDIFNGKARQEKATLLPPYYDNSATPSPLLHWVVGPCKDRDGMPFYGVEGNIVQWKSANSKGLFEKMAWCQRIKIALQIDTAMEWFDREGLEYGTYVDWDDRSGNAADQTGISIDGEFKIVDAMMELQNNTANWEFQRRFVEENEKFQETDFVHGMPRIRRACAKNHYQHLLKEWKCEAGNASDETCKLARDALRTWVAEQAELPYESAPGSTPSLASAMKSITDSQDFSSCVAESTDAQRSLLLGAYAEDVAKGSREPPKDMVEK